MVSLLFYCSQVRHILRGEKLQMSQNTHFHFAICRFRKIQIFIPFANCSKPFLLIQCLSQFLKLIVRPPLNYSFFFKGFVFGNGNLFQHFSPLSMLDNLSKSVDVQFFCVFFFQRKSKWPLFELLEKVGPMYSQPISCEETLRCLKNYQFNSFYI